MAVVEGSPGDKLVPWSYIGTDSAITLCKATNVCHTYVRDQDPLIISAIEDAEAVWKRGLVEKLGLANGPSRNT
ncbi:hypothetical protein DCAR_0416737 [Daucus carota subsp. sativus]|uniref:Uncharacterized protein n=1 Tax=Daucus carota subsp. sativus TaxID=79200 RepID=A0A165XR74_DAUCS|nr:hypothetical protein DCAR_0416737 [Daucus carota subsp. sativus]